MGYVNYTESASAATAGIRLRTTGHARSRLYWPDQSPVPTDHFVPLRTAFYLELPILPLAPLLPERATPQWQLLQAKL
jgi:hypothetical protein